jgi:hypothetical protein
MAVRLSALRAGRTLPPRRFLVLICVDPRNMVWLEGLGQFKNPMTSSGIEPATFRLVTCEYMKYHMLYKRDGLRFTIFFVLFVGDGVERRRPRRIIR